MLCTNRYRFRCGISPEMPSTALNYIEPAFLNRIALIRLGRRKMPYKEESQIAGIKPILILNKNQ